MLNDNALKIKLLLDYEISILYLDSGASTSMISEKTEIPNGSIKRSLKTVGERTDDYIRILPHLGTKEELQQLQRKIDEQIKYNINKNKWVDRELSDSLYQSRIDSIKKLKEEFDELSPKITEKDIKAMKNLRLQGYPYRVISKKTGYSLSMVHKYVTEGKKRNVI